MLKGHLFDTPSVMFKSALFDTRTDELFIEDDISELDKLNALVRDGWNIFSINKEAFKILIRLYKKTDS